VLYEDANTNRMDEALVLFDQICNHTSFKKTSMILFLNKRDLFEAKLKKKDMTCWRPNDPEIKAIGQDYDKAIAYLKGRFLDKNKDKLIRQVYVHATCATDTNNIAFVMESVFDIILKDNLRKLAKADLSKIMDSAGGTGNSTVQTCNVWKPDKAGKIILAACWYSEELGERKVTVTSDTAELPGVMLMNGLKIQDADWSWVMGLGKDCPILPVLDSEKGSFKGSFKEAADELCKVMSSKNLGSVYDHPVLMEKDGMKTTVIAVIKKMKACTPPSGLNAVEHEEFENACYKKFSGVDTDANPCQAPGQGEEFNPFAAHPVHHRWFKGITLYTKEVMKTPGKGVYLGIFKVCSSTDGFKIMVNEHNRISIPMIFLTETQLTSDEVKWMHGVRVREDQFKIDLLEGKQPNRGWLGPEMNGEEGATFPEKLWWAIDEAKARLDTQTIGFQYDRELLFIDEKNNIQLLLFGMLAKDEQDLLTGHIWVSRETLEVQNMKYNCPVVLQAMLNETQGKINEYQALAAQDAGDWENAKKLRTAKDSIKNDIERLYASQNPLKWVNRVIMWCAEKMPSFGAGIEGKDANEVVEKAMANNAEMDANNEQRSALINKYQNQTA